MCYFVTTSHTLIAIISGKIVAKRLLTLPGAEAKPEWPKRYTKLLAGNPVMRIKILKNRNKRVENVISVLCSQWLKY
jgi:hypothetical protein